MDFRSAIAFGKDVIKDYKREDKEPPAFVYERLIELYEGLVERLELTLDGEEAE